MKKSIFIKLFITVFFFIILFYKINFTNIIHAFQSLNVIYLTFALLLVPLLLLIRAWRWQIFLDSSGIVLSLRDTLKITLIGTFYGLITPGKIGEFGRAIHVKERKSITIPTIIMEKLLDIGVLLALSLITTFFLFKDSSFISISLFVITLCIFLIVLLSINEKILFICKFRRSPSSTMMVDPRLVIKSTMITFVYYSIAYCFAFLIVRAGNMQFDGIFVMPIVVLIGNIPITISGLGLRESIGSLCFILLGESAANGFIFSLFLFLFITVFPAIGGYIFSMMEGTYENE